MEKLSLQNDELAVQSLYNDLVGHWNDQDANGFAALFTIDGYVIGFDGSQMDGKKEINEAIAKIFAHHKVASYIAVTKEVKSLAPAFFLLRAVAGMIPPGSSKVNPAVNAIQTLVAQKENGQFKIVLFQNTPAAFHERPELGQQLTSELQQAFDSRSSKANEKK